MTKVTEVRIVIDFLNRKIIESSHPGVTWDIAYYLHKVHRGWLTGGVLFAYAPYIESENSDKGKVYIVPIEIVDFLIEYKEDIDLMVMMFEDEQGHKLWGISSNLWKLDFQPKNHPVRPQPVVAESRPLEQVIERLIKEPKQSKKKANPTPVQLTPDLSVKPSKIDPEVGF